MREIKFRAWNGKSMIEYNHWFTLHQQEVLCFYKNGDPSYVDESDIDYPKRVNLMQFTGLLDKNGKEIYEGDIIKYHKVIDDYDNWEYFNYELYQDKYGAWKLKGWDNNMTWEDYSDQPILSLGEIIGNIYENPELINNN